MPSDDHGDEGDDHKMIKCSTWKRRKRKNKTLWRSRQRYCLGFGFSDQDTIEGVITLRIDSQTLFEKMKCIFSIAPLGNLEKSRECSSLRNIH